MTAHILPMDTPSPFLTAASAAKALGYASGSYLTLMCHAGKVPGAYKDGRIWLIPREWVEAKKKADEEAGIVRGKAVGRPVTTGTGTNRKRPAYVSNGRPRGRPPKNKVSD